MVQIAFSVLAKGVIVPSFQLTTKVTKIMETEYPDAYRWTRQTLKMEGFILAIST